MKAAKYILLVHIIGCVSFFLLPLIFFPHPSNTSAIINNPPTQRDFIAQALLIGFFYLNSFYLIPNFYFNRKYFLFYCIILLCLLFVLMFPSLLTHHLPFYQLNHLPPPNKHFNKPPDFSQHKFDGPPSSPHPDDSPFLPEISHDIFLFFIVFFFSLSLKINNRLNKVQLEKTDAELSYLKSQINPHFLFNTLNLIYSLTIKKSEQASEAIIKLADMMRYVLYESNKNFVPLQQEINYIKNYIELQQTRFGSSIKLLFKVSGDDLYTKKIAPLILIPFVENTFKHGINAEENSDIKIYIEIEKTNLQLKVHNIKVKTTELNKDEGGVGITNTTNRLSLLYPNKHELHIEDTASDFFVHLKLQLND